VHQRPSACYRQRDHRVRLPVLILIPVIVGAGKRFFTETTAKKNLRLVETKTFHDGIHVLVYRSA
jgi:dihydrofolate reductase